MKKNLGSTDKMIRLTLALLFAVLYFTHIVTGTAGVVLLVIAFVFLITSVVSVCPLYSLFRINTRKSKSEA